MSVIIGHATIDGATESSNKSAIVAFREGCMRLATLKAEVTENDRRRATVEERLTRLGELVMRHGRLDVGRR